MLRMRYLAAIVCYIFIVQFITSTARAQQAAMQYRPVVTDTFGNMVSEVSSGDDFMLHMYVQDLRGSSPTNDFGVFSGFIDVIYDDNLFAPNGDIIYGSHYPFVHRGDLSTPGLMDEVGAVDGIAPFGLGVEEILLFSVPMRANGPMGSGSFVTDPADILPEHETTVYGWNTPVPSSQQMLLTYSLTVVPEPAALLMTISALVCCLSLRRGT